MLTCLRNNDVQAGTSGQLHNGVDGLRAPLVLRVLLARGRERELADYRMDAQLRLRPTRRRLRAPTAQRGFQTQHRATKYQLGNFGALAHRAPLIVARAHDRGSSQNTAIFWDPCSL